MASDPFFDGRRGQWVMKYKPDPNGKWVRQVLCDHPGWSRSKPPKRPTQEAIDRHREFAEIEYRARHGLGAAPARARPLAAYAESYADSQAISTKAGSNKQLRRHIRTFLEFAEGRGVTTLQGVTKALCRDYLEGRSKVAGGATLRTERGYLIGIWTRAVDDGLMLVNPWSKVEIPGKKAETSVTFWSPEEIVRIADACTKEWQRDFVKILANTALRISTGLAMEWGWVDWKAGEIRVPAGVEDVKTAYSLAMGGVARDILTRRLAMSDGRSPLVFPNPFGDRGVVSYETARSSIDRAIRRAGVKHGTPHDLRHSCARNMILAGVPVTVVQRQLGHSTLAMTSRYVTADADTAARYIEGFGIGEA